MTAATRTYLLCGYRFATILSSLLVSACGGDNEPCYGLKVGQELEVEIVERYDAASQFPGALPQETCAAGLDLAASDMLLIAVERQTSHDAIGCQTSHFTVENGEAFGWTNIASKNAGQTPPDELVGVLSASFEGCEGAIQLQIRPGRRTEDLFAISEPGKEPYFVLRREFKVPDECSLDPCADEYVVTIRNAP